MSKNLSALASSILFAEICLEFADADEESILDCTRCQEIITALTTHSTHIFENTKKLYLSTTSLHRAQYRRGSNPIVAEIRDFVAQKMFDAILALSNLQVIEQVFPL